MFSACVLTSSRSGHFDCAVGFDWALTMQGNIVAATIQIRNASLNALRPQRELRVIHNPWPRTIVFGSPFTLITLVQNISSVYSSTGLVRSRPSGLTPAEEVAASLFARAQNSLSSFGYLPRVDWVRCDRKPITQKSYLRLSQSRNSHHQASALGFCR